MAMQVTLVEAHPATSDGSSLRLDSNSAGISILNWAPKVANDGDAWVDEVLTLQIAGSSHDDLASKIQALDAMIRMVPYFRSSAQVKGIFLRCQLTGETGARQALVLAARRENLTALYGPPVSPGNMVETYRLTLRRMPWWERTDDVVIAAATLTSLIGDALSVSSIPGDMPARLMPLSFEGHLSGSALPVTEIWAGFRTARYGTLANFVPVWNCKDGTNGTDASDTADATANSGTRVTVTFATNETMVSRSSLIAYQITANVDDQRGRFLVLLRAKVTAGTAYVRMKAGMYPTVMETKPRVAISSTSWRFYPLGEITFPPISEKIGAVTSMYLATIDLYASGAAAVDLHLDCCVLIPTDEGFCHFSGGTVEKTAGYTLSTDVGQEADGAIYVGNRTAVNFNGMPDASGTAPGSFHMPVGDSKLIVAGQATSVSTLADHHDVAIAYTPRWAMLRGAE